MTDVGVQERVHQAVNFTNRSRMINFNSNFDITVRIEGRQHGSNFSREINQMCSLDDFLIFNLSMKDRSILVSFPSVLHRDLFIQMNSSHLVITPELMSRS